MEPNDIPFTIAIQALDEGFVLMSGGRTVAVTTAAELGRRVTKVAQEVAKGQPKVVQPGVVSELRDGPPQANPPRPPQSAPLTAQGLAAQQRNLALLNQAFVEERITREQWADKCDSHCYAIPPIERELALSNAVAAWRDERMGDDDDTWEEVQ